MTELNTAMTILLAGEAEAGTAEVQPARDSRTKATDDSRDDSIMAVIPSFQISSGAFLCFKNLLAEGKGRS